MSAARGKTPKETPVASAEWSVASAKAKFSEVVASAATSPQTIKRNGKPVGICGEAAADPLLAVVLVGIGATTLSMAPTALADVRASLLQYTREDAERIAAAALAADDAASARSAAQAAAENTA